MAQEFNALLANCTLSLVPRQEAQNPVGNKWIYKIKRKSDGSIERHKVRLVAKGFYQRSGVDFTDTFNPTVKPQTVQTVLSAH